MEELVYRLSAQCGYETVSVSVPMKDQLPTSWHCGMHSLAGVKTLMKNRFDRDVYAMALNKHDLKVMSKSDIEHVYKNLFHSLVRESRLIFKYAE